MAYYRKSSEMNKKDPDKKLSISFYSKTKTICPVCKKDFQKEEMLTGGGRMIAGTLTDELRRNFEPSVKYGKVYPLIYTIGACPNCHAAFFWQDFSQLTDVPTIGKLMDNEKIRREAANTIFPHYNLKHE